MLVGQPCYHLLRRQGYTIDQCDIHTPDIPSITRQADLIVSAVGKPGLITKEWVKPGACIVDIGTRCVKDAFGVCNHLFFFSPPDNLTGDVDLNSCVGRAGFVTPVPGGVALLTTAMLMYNTVKSFVYLEGLVDEFNAISEYPLLVGDQFAYKSFIGFIVCLQMSERKSEKRYCESDEWNERYSRQIRLDNVGIEGQVVFVHSKIMNRKKSMMQGYW